MNMILFGIVAVIVVIVCVIAIVIMNQAPSLDGSYKLYTLNGREVPSNARLTITIEGDKGIVEEHSKDSFTLKKTEIKEKGNVVYEMYIPTMYQPLKLPTLYLQDKILTVSLTDSHVLTFKKVSNKQLTQDEIYKI